LEENVGHYCPNASTRSHYMCELHKTSDNQYTTLTPWHIFFHWPADHENGAKRFMVLCHRSPLFCGSTVHLHNWILYEEFWHKFSSKPVSHTNKWFLFNLVSYLLTLWHKIFYIINVWHQSLLNMLGGGGNTRTQLFNICILFLASPNNTW
jgi:hypothetical protein